MSTTNALSDTPLPPASRAATGASEVRGVLPPTPTTHPPQAHECCLPLRRPVPPRRCRRAPDNDGEHRGRKSILEVMMKFLIAFVVGQFIGCM